MKYLPSVETLQKVVEELQPIMGIQDWDIQVDVVDVNTMTVRYQGDDTYNGDSYRNVRRNFAVVTLVDKETEDDWYDTIVHEMLHVQMTLLDHCTQSYLKKNYTYLTDLKEQYVDKLTRMFVKLHPCKEEYRE